MDTKMQNVLNVIRTVVFGVSIIIITIVLAVTFLPALFSKKVAHFCAMKWSGAVIYLAKVVAGVDYEILNPNNIDTTGAIIVANHCSTWETIFMSNYFNIPTFIIKKTLFFIPIVGQFLKIVGMVGIDRKTYNKQSRNYIVSQVSKALQNNRNVAIFPQGTRVPTNQTFNYEKYPFKSGVVMFIGNNKVVTASNNSRQYFGKGMFSMKKKGKVSFLFNEALQFNETQSKSEIIQEIQHSVETGCKKIAKPSV